MISGKKSYNLNFKKSVDLNQLNPSYKCDIFIRLNKFIVLFGGGFKILEFQRYLTLSG